MLYLYILTDPDKIRTGTYKVGFTSCDRKGIISQYTRQLPEVALIFHEQFYNAKQLENRIKVEFNKHRIDNVNGNQSEWYRCPSYEIISYVLTHGIRQQNDNDINYRMQRLELDFRNKINNLELENRIMKEQIRSALLIFGGTPAISVPTANVPVTEMITTPAPTSNIVTPMASASTISVVANDIPLVTPTGPEVLQCMTTTNLSAAPRTPMSLKINTVQSQQKTSKATQLAPLVTIPKTLGTQCTSTVPLSAATAKVTQCAPTMPPNVATPKIIQPTMPPNAVTPRIIQPTTPSNVATPRITQCTPVISSNATLSRIIQSTVTLPPTVATPKAIQCAPTIALPLAAATPKTIQPTITLPLAAATPKIVQPTVPVLLSTAPPMIPKYVASIKTPVASQPVANQILIPIATHNAPELAPMTPRRSLTLAVNQQI